MIRLKPLLFEMQLIREVTKDHVHVSERLSGVSDKVKIVTLSNNNQVEEFLRSVSR